MTFLLTQLIATKLRLVFDFDVKSGFVSCSVVFCFLSLLLFPFWACLGYWFRFGRESPISDGFVCLFNAN